MKLSNVKRKIHCQPLAGQKSIIAYQSRRVSCGVVWFKLGGAWPNMAGLQADRHMVLKLLTATIYYQFQWKQHEIEAGKQTSWEKWAREKQRKIETEKEQQHALLILKSIADWGRYIVCHKGDEEGKGGKRQSTKSDWWIWKTIRISNELAEWGSAKEGRGGRCDCTRYTLSHLSPSRSPSPLNCRSGFHTLTVASVPLCRPANLLHILWV